MDTEESSMSTVPQHYRELILAALSDRPQTIYDLLKIVPLGREGLREHLATMTAEGEIHISGRRPAGALKAARMHVYSAGAASKPLPSATTDGVLQYIRIHRNRTVQQLAEAIGFSDYNIRRQIKMLREGAGKSRLYISGWTISGMSRIAHYSAGNHPDMPRPGKVSHTENSRRYHKRLYQDPDRHALILAKRRAKAMIKRVKKAHPDPLIAALFGMRPANNAEKMAA
jgi:hypothetical protein